MRQADRQAHRECLRTSITRHEMLAARSREGHRLGLFGLHLLRETGGAATLTRLPSNHPQVKMEGVDFLCVAVSRTRLTMCETVARAVREGSRR